MRPTWRSLTAGVLASVVLLALLWRPAPHVPLAEAQGVGIFSRTLCSTLTGVVSGQTFCFEQTTNTLKFWNGSAWVQATPAQGGIPNIRDYGALCDGTTDDGPAVQLAINAATASGFNTLVLVPPTATSCRIATALTNLSLIDFVFTGTGDFSGPAIPSTANKVKFTPGIASTAALFVQNNSNSDAILGVVNGTGGIGVHGQVSSGNGIAVRGDGVSTSQPTVVGSATGFYAGSFFNITDAGSDALNANQIGLVGQSGYANAGYFQAGQVGVALTRNNQYPSLYVTRVGPLGGFNFTAPLIRGDDTTTTTGPMFVLARQGASGATGMATVSIINTDGSFAMGTATVLNGAAWHLETNIQNQGMIAFNNNGPSIGADSVSTPIYIGGRNAAGTIGNVSIEALTNTGAAPDMLIRSGASGNKVGNGTQQIVVKNTGGVIVGSLSNTARGAGSLTVASAVYLNNVAAVSATGSLVNLQNINSISATGRNGANLRGSCTFSAAATCAVTFGTNEPDASYFVTVTQTSGTTMDAFRVSTKAVSGFTINASQSNSNSVDWMLLR